MKLFIHFVENNKDDIDTYIAEVEPSFTIDEVLKLAVINCRKELDPKSLNLFKEFGANALERTVITESEFNEYDDVFIIYSGIKPVKV